MIVGVSGDLFGDRPMFVKFWFKMNTALAKSDVDKKLTIELHNFNGSNSKIRVRQKNHRKRPYEMVDKMENYHCRGIDGHEVR